MHDVEKWRILKILQCEHRKIFKVCFAIYVLTLSMKELWCYTGIGKLLVQTLLEGRPSFAN